MSAAPPTPSIQSSTGRVSSTTRASLDRGAPRRAEAVGDPHLMEGTGTDRGGHWSYIISRTQEIVFWEGMR